jgi:deoxyribose-phosphate aldolase
MTLTPAQLAGYIDHTLLKADATKWDIEHLCRDAIAYAFYAVCVNSSRVVQAATIVHSTPVKVAAVVGFPLGATDTDAKRYETELAIDLGAQEIDLVINIGRLKDGDDRMVFRELRDVVESADGVPVKVIVETGLLTRDEKIRACSLVVESGAKFIKTSTGFGPSGATVEDVRLFREHGGEQLGIKASGGIRDTALALALLEAGATRLGTSAGIAIVQGLVAAEGAY